MSILSIIAKIDSVISKALSLVYEDDKFKSIFHTWSSALFLISGPPQVHTKVKILNVKLQEITDLASYNNALFDKLINELETPGGEPFSILVMQYEMNLKNKSHIQFLSNFALYCANIYAPVLIDVNPNLITDQCMSNLEKISIYEIKKDINLVHAKELAKEPNAMFLAAVISKIYAPSILSDVKTSKFGDFNFEKYKTVKIGGNFGVASVIKNCFEQTGWFLDIVGYELYRDNELALFGNVPNLISKPYLGKHFSHSALALGYKVNTPVFVSEFQEKDLSKIGFISLAQVVKDKQLILYNARSFKVFANDNTSEGFDSTTHVQYILCVSRFMHYLKVIGRTKIGEFLNPQSFEQYLNKWIVNYIASNPDVEQSLKRKYPLLAAKVQVGLDPFLDKKYHCTIDIKLHLTASSYPSTEIVLKTCMAY
jgi:type VI secretion system ImpC/EvpB family protein